MLKYSRTVFFTLFLLSFFADVFAQQQANPVIFKGDTLFYIQNKDRVKIKDIVGDVVRKNLLVTRIKTLKNEEITIPNATLLGGGIVRQGL